MDNSTRKKRKIPGTAANDDSRISASKRQRKDNHTPSVSSRPPEPKTHYNKRKGRKESQKVLKKGEMADDEPTNPELPDSKVSQSHSGRDTIKAAQKDSEVEVKSDDEFFQSIYLMRQGIMNNERVSARDQVVSPIAYTRFGRLAKDGNVAQSDEQVHLESFFMNHSGTGGMTLRDVENRFNFIEKLGDWRQLSLILRLNLIESVQQVEAYKDTDTKKTRWDIAKQKASKLRIDFEGAQVLLKNPRNWGNHNKSTINTRDERIGDGDKHGASRAGRPMSPRETPAATSLRGRTQRTGTRPVVPPAKDPASWENLRFTAEKEQEFQDLLAMDKIEDVDEKREESKRGHYQAEEYCFLFRWMEAVEAKASSTDKAKVQWTAASLATITQLERAYKRFFTEFEFADGTKRTMCRKGPAIFRALKRVGTDVSSSSALVAKFAKFFPGTKKESTSVLRLVRDNRGKKVGNGAEGEDGKSDTKIGGTSKVEKFEIGAGREGQGDEVDSGENEGGLGSHPLSSSEKEESHEDDEKDDDKPEYNKAGRRTTSRKTPNKEIPKEDSDDEVSSSELDSDPDVNDKKKRVKAKLEAERRAEEKEKKEEADYARELARRKQFNRNPTKKVKEVKADEAVFQGQDKNEGQEQEEGKDEVKDQIKDEDEDEDEEKNKQGLVQEEDADANNGSVYGEEEL